MKQFLGLLLFLAISSGPASAQTLRTCGCKTWSEWKKGEGDTKDSRREKRQKYAVYRDQCLAACKNGKPGEPKKEEPSN